MLACSAAAMQLHAQFLMQPALLVSQDLCVSLRLCSIGGGSAYGKVLSLLRKGSQWLRALPQTREF